MGSINILQKIILWGIPLLFAITVHEVAHGWIAAKLGDPTAKMLGRLTLNPIKHIDLIGTIIVPLTLLMLGGFIFGWAKPVPITWQNLKNPKRDTALVALAGPMANLMMALLWAMVAKIGSLLKGNDNSLSLKVIIAMGEIGIIVNIVLLILNLFPIPPLDGSRIVSAFLPGRLAYQYNRLELVGFFILIGLIATGVLQYILLPLVSYSQALIYLIFNL